SLSPTSSFEQPRAISSTTCSCRSVRTNGSSLGVLLMTARLRPRAKANHRPMGVFADRRGGGSDARGAEPAAHEARLVPARVRLVAGGEDAVADPVGPQHLEDLAELLTPHLAAFLADVDRHAEAGSTGLLDHRLHGAVVIARATRPRAGDVDADDAARRPGDRL